MFYRWGVLLTAAAALGLALRADMVYPAEDAAGEAAAYEPAPENLAMRQWFRDARFGIFIHWGVYSVLEDGEWVMQIRKMPVADYEKLPPRFNPTEFDAAQWVSLFKQAGAKYITITSKHHDGFAMWDSAVSDWDIVDRTPYKRDVLKALADECHRQGLKLFFYHSQLDWHHSDYYPRGWTGQFSGRPEAGDFNKYLDYMDAQLAELLSGRYGRLGGIWFDGWWDQHDRSAGANPRAMRVDWRLDQSYALIHRLQPQVLIGNNHHVSVFLGEDFQMFEQDLPGENKAGLDRGAQISGLPLETCATINGAWGYNANDHNFKTARDLIHLLVRAAGCDANLLLNIGPRPDGTIQPEFIERLQGIGCWLDKHGETIYGTRGGPMPRQTWGVATHKNQDTYLHVLDPPSAAKDDWATLTGTAELRITCCKLFDGCAAIEWKRDSAGNLQVRLPAGAADQIDTILVVR
jgi:alpha-L-fucosidase